MEAVSIVAASLLSVFVVAAAIVHPPDEIMTGARTLYGLGMLVAMDLMLFIPTAGRAQYTQAFVIGMNLAHVRETAWTNALACVAMYVYMCLDMGFTGQRVDLTLNRVALVLTVAFLIAFSTWTIVMLKRDRARPSAAAGGGIFTVITLACLVAADCVEWDSTPYSGVLLIAAFCLGRESTIATVVAFFFLVGGTAITASANAIFLVPLVPLCIATFIHLVRQTFRPLEIAAAAAVVLWAVCMTLFVYALSDPANVAIATAGILALVVLALCAAVYVYTRAHPEKCNTS